MRRGRPCCRPRSLQASIPPSRELDTHRSQRCRRPQKSWCRRWWREPGDRLAPRCSHTLSPRQGGKPLSPPLCIAASPLPSVSACNRASQRRNNLELVDLCTLASTLARKHSSPASGSLAPRSQKPPCSLSRLGSQGKFFDLEGHTGTRRWFHKPDPQHWCTAALAPPCTPPSQQEHTPRGSPGERCLKVKNMIQVFQIVPGNMFTHWTAILLRGSIGWHRRDVVRLANLGGDHLLINECEFTLCIFQQHRHIWVLLRIGSSGHLTLGLHHILAFFLQHSAALL